MEENKTIFEINGVKFEVDMQTATRIDEFKVGDNIKVLRKDFSNHKIENGVIVDFVAFKDLPTIQVAVFKTGMFDGDTIEFININEETEDIEIVPASKHELQLEKNAVIDRIDQKIEKLESEAETLLAKKKWFVEYYGKYFEGNDNYAK